MARPDFETKKFLVSMPVKLRLDIDEIGLEEGRTRSDLVREAVRSYIADYRSRRMQEMTRKRIEAAGQSVIG
jgi:metal-responsive CopG/Arc/MetJ family transcriptional regulator